MLAKGIRLIDRSEPGGREKSRSLSRNAAYRAKTAQITTVSVFARVLTLAVASPLTSSDSDRTLARYRANLGHA